MEGKPGRLEGRKVLVTGAAGGIGKEIALNMAKEGADVAVHYNSQEEVARDVAESVEKLGRKSFLARADVSKWDDTERMRKEVLEKFGRVDCLVNNAGINRDMMFQKMGLDEWRKVLGVNLDGYFHCIKAFVDDIVQSKWGRIINITSVIGQIGNIGQSNYAASKAGIIGLTKALAKELARKRVTVNAIAPGFILTQMVERIPDNVKEKIIAQIPMRCFGDPWDVAMATVFLASDEGKYITGHILNVNGGMYIFEPGEA